MLAKKGKIKISVGCRKHIFGIIISPTIYVFKNKDFNQRLHILVLDRIPLNSFIDSFIKKNLII